MGTLSGQIMKNLLSLIALLLAVSVTASRGWKNEPGSVVTSNEPQQSGILMKNSDGEANLKVDDDHYWSPDKRGRAKASKREWSAEEIAKRGRGKASKREWSAEEIAKRGRKKAP